MRKKILSLILIGLAVLVLPNIVLRTAEAAEGGGITNIGQLVDKVSKAVFDAMTGVVLIAWLVIAFLYLTAWGTPEKLKTAHHAVVWAAVGTAILILYKSIQIIIANALK